MSVSSCATSALQPATLAIAWITHPIAQSATTNFAPPPVDIYAVYPHNRHLSAKVRAFIDHYVDWLHQRRQEMPFS